MILEDVEIFLNTEDRKLIKQAAKIRGLTLRQYIIRCTLEQAIEDVNYRILIEDSEGLSDERIDSIANEIFQERIDNEEVDHNSIVLLIDRVKTEAHTNHYYKIFKVKRI